MAKDTLHELHHRRAGRNLGLLVALLALVAIVFGLAMVKIRQGGMLEAFDHQPRASMLPRDPDARPRQPAPETDAAIPSADASASEAPGTETDTEATP